jgi:hypothetical protein
MKFDDIAQWVITYRESPAWPKLSQQVNSEIRGQARQRESEAGVLEEEMVTYPEKGPPQGAVISPMLSNIFLHHVLDDWFVREVQPRLKGRSFRIRFADDFVIGCEFEEDARRMMNVLPKRFGRSGLTIHPEKTVLTRFSKPDGRGNSALN